MELKKRRLIRIIIPRFPHYNIYSLVAKITTSVGPLYVATSASKLDCWDAEVIDENNLHGRFYPRSEEGGIDHKRLQQESPADVVGFYGSITSSVPRLFQLAREYKAMGCMTIAGGKHVENLPEEALANGIDFVFFREAEVSIRKFLERWDAPEDRCQVKGIAFLRNGTMVKTPDRDEIENLDQLPVPDFSLLRFAKMKLYPVSGTRGCGSNCEFCTVKGKPRNCSADVLMEAIKTLVEKYHARQFFEVSDHFAANKTQAIRFLNLFADYQKKIKKRLVLTIQTRLTDARSEEYLAALKKARVDTVCIGFESPIDEHLLSMNKGYLSENMLHWTRLIKKQKVKIHGMFIFAYPSKGSESHNFSVKHTTDVYWRFIKKSRIDTVQHLLAIPLPGTELRQRLQEEHKLFPTGSIGWEYYDGQFPLYDPGDVRAEEIQKAVGQLNSRFYNRSAFIRMIKNIVFDFPLIIAPSIFTLPSGKVRYMTRAFNYWYRTFFQKNFIRLGGRYILKKWFKAFKYDNFRRKLEEQYSAK